MARILYCVSGEGMGHAIRSAPVIEHLVKKHKVVVLSYSRAHLYLKERFRNVHDIHGFHFIYKNNKVDPLGTIKDSFKRLPKIFYFNMNRFAEVFKNFEPHVVITDFEPSSVFFSSFFNAPVISIDNIHMISRCKPNCPSKCRRELIFAKLALDVIFPRIKYFFITTFFYPEIRNKHNTVLVPPILRDSILKAKTSKKDHILVYQTSKTYRKMFSVLKSFKEIRFIIYGFDYEKKDKNIIFKKFSETEFIKDLASCRAVITNGGFSLMSEAVYLGKPVFSVPVRQQIEQIVNAYNVDRLGYGMYCKSLNIKNFKKFLGNICKYKINLRKHRQDGNKTLFKKLDQLIRNLV